MLVLPRSGAVILIVIALGLISGLPAGPIMSLPARVLQPATRAIGMGLFFTVYYAAMMLGPVIGGASPNGPAARRPPSTSARRRCLRARYCYGASTGLLRRDRKPRECPHLMQPPITHR